MPTPISTVIMKHETIQGGLVAYNQWKNANALLESHSGTWRPQTSPSGKPMYEVDGVPAVVLSTNALFNPKDDRYAIRMSLELEGGEKQVIDFV